MPYNRRKFISHSALGSAALLGGLSSQGCTPQEKAPQGSGKPGEFPIVLSTWDFGAKANREAWKVLGTGGAALDAVEQGVRLIEADEANDSVGYGGLPDREGRVTLDACIMDSSGKAGSVCALEHIMHPVSVARAVMEKTPHVILVGEGALEFALSQGFEKQDLLTEKARSKWLEWKKESKYEPKINSEMHDTIGTLAIDKSGNISGCCTTSGLAFKMRGRVGDSPIIGAGLYVDNEVGGATATGLGELVLRSLGSFLIVELMRQGRSPQEACEEAVRRIYEKLPDKDAYQVGFIAVNKRGETGAFSIQPGFMYAVKTESKDEVVNSPSIA